MYDLVVSFLATHLTFFVAFDEPLDFVSVHEALITEFTEALGLHARATAEGQADAIAGIVASHLGDRPALLAVSEFCSL